MKGRALGALEKTLAGLVKAQTELTDERRQLVERLEEIDEELAKFDAAGAALRPLVSSNGQASPARPTSPSPDGMLTRLRDELRKRPGEILSPRQLAELTGYTAGVVAMQCTKLGPEVEHMVGRGYRWRGAT